MIALLECNPVAERKIMYKRYILMLLALIDHVQLKSALNHFDMAS